MIPQLEDDEDNGEEKKRESNAGAVLKLSALQVLKRELEVLDCKVKMGW